MEQDHLKEQYKELEDQLSEAILKGNVKKGSTVLAETEDNKIVFKCKE